jgi:hypothetical protein
VQRIAAPSATATWVGFAGAAAIAVTLIGITGAGTTFTGDEWGILFRLADRPLADAVFDPPAGKYLLVLPTLVYAALSELFGTDSYLPYRVVGMVLVVLAAVLYLEFARRRTGHALALGGAIVLMFFGAASDVVAIPGRIPSQIAMCAGLGMFLGSTARTRAGTSSHASCARLLSPRIRSGSRSWRRGSSASRSTSRQGGGRGRGWS